MSDDKAMVGINTLISDYLIISINMPPQYGLLLFPVQWFTQY